MYQGVPVIPEITRDEPGTVAILSIPSVYIYIYPEPSPVKTDPDSHHVVRS